MSGLAADLLAGWLVATAACSALLVLIVAVQDALARARRRRALRRRTAGSGARHPGTAPRTS